MMSPLVSVVIPTHSRPAYLPRAIYSALQSGPDGDVEVVVVPNGPDESWRQIAARFKHDPRVRWDPVATAHANVARNHGLSLARGKYVRFLDDDDYLLAAAEAQCLLLEASGCDVSQGGIGWIDERGNLFHSRQVSETSDFLAAILSPDVFTLPTSLLWRRERIRDRTWNPSVNLGQDVAFAFSIARDLEVSLHQCEFQVGVWRHHVDSRISGNATRETHARIQSEVLVDTLAGLDKRNALTSSRRELLGAILWHRIHEYFPQSPFYWSRIARKTLKILPESRPVAAAFQRRPFSAMNPLIAEWLLAPRCRLRAQRKLGKQQPPADPN